MPSADAWECTVGVELDFRPFEALGFLVREWLDTEGDLVLLTMTEDPVVEVNGCSAIDCLCITPETLACLVADASSGRGMAEGNADGLPCGDHPPFLSLVRSRPAVV